MCRKRIRGAKNFIAKLHLSDCNFIFIFIRRTNMVAEREVTRAVLSQGGPRDAAVNFDKKIYNGIARFLCHSTAFL